MKTSSSGLQDKLQKVFGAMTLSGRKKAQLDFLIEDAVEEAGGPDKVTLEELQVIKELIEGMTF